MTRSSLRRQFSSRSFAGSRVPITLLAVGASALSVVAVTHSLVPHAFAANSSAAAKSGPPALARFARRTPPRLTLKAGHTYELSVDRMGRIIGAANASLAPGTTTSISAYGGSTGDAAPIGYWEVDLPNGSYYTGGASTSTAGWRVRASTIGAITITVPTGTAPGTYDAFYNLKNVNYTPPSGPGPYGGPPTVDQTASVNRKASGMTPEVVQPPPSDGPISYGPAAVFNVT